LEIPAFIVELTSLLSSLASSFAMGHKYFFASLFLSSLKTWAHA